MSSAGGIHTHSSLVSCVTRLLIVPNYINAGRSSNASDFTARRLPCNSLCQDVGVLKRFLSVLTAHRAHLNHTIAADIERKSLYSHNTIQYNTKKFIERYSREIESEALTVDIIHGMTMVRTELFILRVLNLMIRYSIFTKKHLQPNYFTHNYAYHCICSRDVVRCGSVDN